VQAAVAVEVGRGADTDRYHAECNAHHAHQLADRDLPVAIAVGRARRRLRASRRDPAQDAEQNSAQGTSDREQTDERRRRHPFDVRM
jgi:hypothetical protein